jgi:hypothetical protein
VVAEQAFFFSYRCPEFQLHYRRMSNKWECLFMLGKIFISACDTWSIERRDFGPLAHFIRKYAVANGTELSDDLFASLDDGVEEISLDTLTTAQFNEFVRLSHSALGSMLQDQRLTAADRSALERVWSSLESRLEIDPRYDSDNFTPLI